MFHAPDNITGATLLMTCNYGQLPSVDDSCMYNIIYH